MAELHQKEGATRRAFARSLYIWGGIFITAITLFSNMQALIGFSNFVRGLTEEFRELVDGVFDFVLGWLNIDLPPELSMAIMTFISFMSIVAGTWWVTDEVKKVDQYRVYSIDTPFNFYLGSIIGAVFFAIFGQYFFGSWWVSGAMVAAFAAFTTKRYIQRKTHYQITYKVKRKVSAKTFVVYTVFFAAALVPILASQAEGVGYFYLAMIFICTVAAYIVLGEIGNRLAYRLLVNRLIFVLAGLLFLICFNLVSLAAEKMI